MIDFLNSNLVLVQAMLTGLILALSVQVPLRVGVFSFAGVGSYGIGAYFAAALVIREDVSALVAICAAMILTASIGLLLGVLIYKLAGLYLAMATIAFDLTISVVAINGGEWTGGSLGLYGVIADFPMMLMLALTVLALALVIISELGRTSRRVDAVRDDPELAASMGIRVRRYRLVAFVVSGALGGLAGSMNVLASTAIGPADIGFGLIVLALTMIIVGGSRSWKGALIGAVIFAWLPHWLGAIGEWQDVVYGIMVALAAVFLPRGIYGLYVDVKKTISRRRRESQAPPKVMQEDEARPQDLATAAAEHSGRPTNASAAYAASAPPDTTNELGTP